MDDIVNQINALGSRLDDEGRVILVQTLDELLCKFESPFSSLRRYGSGQVCMAAAEIACDLGIFKKLVDSRDGCQLGDLARVTGASEDLLGSIMRFLASVHMVDEAGGFRYYANKFTQALAQPAYAGAVKHFSGVMCPTMQAWPRHLKAQEYRSVTEHERTAFQVAFNTELPSFDYIKTRPDMLQNMQYLMTIQRITDEWFSTFPVTEELQSWEPPKPAFVDIGGGWGHQCVALQRRYPQTKGHTVLQDLPETIAAVPTLDGVQAMAYNMFEPQPVQGAKFYYLRSVLHDWPDDKCIEILRNIAPAMGASSRILIDEVVVPEQGVSWQIAQMDLFVMSSLGSRERTNLQWRDLCQRAGFEVLDIVLYSRTFHNSVIVIVPK